jgi:hypothetical protein
LTEEYSIQWASDLLDVEQMIAMTEDCDKDCRSCSKDEKEDCHLEMRECLHSLLKLFKDTILSYIMHTRVVERAIEKNPEVYS